jgi:hypothetical protein
MRLELKEIKYKNNNLLIERDYKENGQLKIGKDSTNNNKNYLKLQNKRN